MSASMSFVLAGFLVSGANVAYAHASVSRECDVVAWEAEEATISNMQLLQSKVTRQRIEMAVSRKPASNMSVSDGNAENLDDEEDTVEDLETAEMLQQEAPDQRLELFMEEADVNHTDEFHLYDTGKASYVASYVFVSTGVAGPTEIWLSRAPTNFPKGSGLNACYNAVMADERCVKDYFTYVNRGDQNCGCKGKGGSISVRNDLNSDYYRVQPSLLNIDMANWMRDLNQIHSKHLLDLSVPAVHDTLTYDLSSTTPVYQDATDAQKHQEGLHLASCLIVDSLDPQNVARNQILDLKGQLDSGIRFLDFRITLSRLCGQLGLDNLQFYGTHFFQTRKPAMHYLGELKEWLDDHPGEIVSMFLSSHGDQRRGCGDGNLQFPGHTDKTAAFWDVFKKLFGGLLINVKQHPPGSTTVSTYVNAKARLLVYAAGFCELQGGDGNDDGYAYDAKTMFLNTGVADGFAGYEQNLVTVKNDLQAAEGNRNKFSGEHKFFSRQLVTSFGTKTIIGKLCSEPAIRAVLGSQLDCEDSEKACYTTPASVSPICPFSLWDTVTLSNFFFQWPLSFAHEKGYALPNGIYMDGISEDGIYIGDGKRSFPMQKMVVVANLGMGPGRPIRDTWNDVSSGRYMAAPVYYPEKPAGVCFDPPRVYKANDGRCTDVVQCNSPGRTGFKHNACEAFPCEGPDCDEKIEDGNPCAKCQCEGTGAFGQDCQPKKINGRRPNGCSCYYAGYGKGCLNHGCGGTKCDDAYRCYPAYNCDWGANECKL